VKRVHISTVNPAALADHDTPLESLSPSIARCRGDWRDIERATFAFG
jgi:hypothetical protein